jgi:hypothetical protein
LRHDDGGGGGGGGDDDVFCTEKTCLNEKDKAWY